MKQRIQRHVEYTGSVKGQAILDDWETASAKFHKVLPTDYERVLVAMKEAEASGLTGDDAILAAFEANAKVGH